MAVETFSVAETCAEAKRASRTLARLDAAAKDAALLAMADALEERADEVLEANARDVEAGAEGGLGDALLDRLALTPTRLAGMAGDVRRIAALPDPVGEGIEARRLPNGLDLRKVRVPSGSSP